MSLLRFRVLDTVKLTLACVALLGCADDLPKATAIERMRILGALLEVVGDETRSTPRPGESVHVSLPTVFPSLENDRTQIQTLLITCTAPDRFTGGLPICQELIDAAQAAGTDRGSPATVTLPEGFPDNFECNTTFAVPAVGPLSLHCIHGEPQATFAVPATYAADELLFVGVVCEEGTAVLDPKLPGLFGCKDNSGEAIALHGLIPVQYPAKDANHNPDMQALKLLRQINGAWNPADPATLVPENEHACLSVARDREADAVLPESISHLDFRIEYDGSVRESYEGEPEALELTLYATAGEIERRFTLFDSTEEGTLRDSLRWRSPALSDVYEGGELVRFYVTIRDERGGFGWAEYAQCMLGTMEATEEAAE